MKRLSVLCALAFVLLAVPAGAQTVLDRSVDRAGAKVLELEAGGAAIVLTPNPDVATVHVRVDQDKSTAVPVLQSVRSGNRLAVTLKPPSGVPFLPFVPSTAATYAITYPASMRLDLRISTGDVRITRPSADVEIYNQDGNIVIDSPHSSVTAENARGDITVAGALAPVDLAADDGSVTASLAAGWSGNEVRIQSGTGTIKLTVPPNFRGRFDASSTQGTVHNAVAASEARSPFVWLYAIKGDVFVAQAKP